MKQVPWLAGLAICQICNCDLAMPVAECPCRCHVLARVDETAKAAKGLQIGFLKIGDPSNMTYTEEQLEKLHTDELRAIVAAIEKRVGCEVIRGRNRAMLIEAILEDQEEKGGSASTMR